MNIVKNVEENIIEEEIVITKETAFIETETIMKEITTERISTGVKIVAEVCLHNTRENVMLMIVFHYRVQFCADHYRDQKNLQDQPWVISVEDEIKPTLQ